MLTKEFVEKKTFFPLTAERWPTFGTDQVVSPLPAFALLLISARSRRSSTRNLGPLLLTHGVDVRRHLLFCGIHLVQKRVHFSGEWKIKADIVERGETWRKRCLAWCQQSTHFFRIGMTGFRMASKILMRMELPRKISIWNSFQSAMILKKKSKH